MRAKVVRLGLAATLALVAGTAPLPASTMYLASYPDEILAFDEGTNALKQTIKLETGLPITMRLSNDRKLLYATTLTTGGIEVIDIASQKVVNSFSLNTPTTRYRFNDGVPDPAGRYYYTIASKMEKLPDRWTIGKPQYLVIDLKTQKIVRTKMLEPEDDFPTYYGTFAMSEDGKTFYLMRDKILAINTADLTVIQRINLAQPAIAGIEDVAFSGGLTAIRNPRDYVSLFNASDPYIHNKIFGIAHFNLTTREFTFAPIGPAPSAMAGLEVTPDGKNGYTVVTFGALGNKRCEFWHFDLAANKVVGKAEFECRSRFTFGMSSDGAKLYIYGASFDIEVYDAATLKLEKTVDLGRDVTVAGMVLAR